MYFYCPECNSANSPDSKYCFRCGSALLPVSPDKDVKSDAELVGQTVPPRSGSTRVGGSLLILVMVLVVGLFLAGHCFTDSSGRLIFSWSWGDFFKVVVLLITGLWSIVQLFMTTTYYITHRSKIADDPLFARKAVLLSTLWFIVLPIAIFILFLRWLLV